LGRVFVALVPVSLVFLFLLVPLEFFVKFSIYISVEDISTTEVYIMNFLDVFDEKRNTQRTERR